ncbi:MAG: RagB/SusD family nutrient uptake outer membrane protein [Pseudosphingobacterium sp.]|nr:RagB/SusD family nutrient uptake outer membrane protein [Pseudosphingobacterium sp.]
MKPLNTQFYKKLVSPLTNGCWMLVLLLLSGCKNFVEVAPPKNSITSESVYTSDETAASVLTGIYTRFNGDIAGGINGMSIRCGLSADELSLFSGSVNQDLVGQYRNDISSQSNNSFWEYLYNYILVTNSAIEGIQQSSTLSSTAKNQLLGESYFLRSFCYFYLVNLYGGVPIVTTPDFSVNAVEPRASVTDVYDLITSDLIHAQEYLSEDYKSANAKDNTTERIRPNKDAALAMLARTKLYVKSYAEAEAFASQVIENKRLYDIETLDNTFLKSSREAIWQLQPTNIGWNTEDARIFILTQSGLSDLTPVYLNNSFISTVKSDDLRYLSWVNSITLSSNDLYYFPFKYKIGTYDSPLNEYLMVLRLSEQYLIRSEARVMQGNIDGAKADLNVIRNRANLPDTEANDKENLLNAILEERRIELFTEWGHRWLDLKRTETINDVMGTESANKGSNWNSNMALFPIPLADIQRNPSLRNAQNPGY